MAAPLERRFLSNFLSRSPKRLGEGDLTTGHESGIGWCHCVSNNIYIYIYNLYYIFCNPCNEQTEQSGFWHRHLKVDLFETREWKNNLSSWFSNFKVLEAFTKNYSKLSVESSFSTSKLFGIQRQIFASQQRLQILWCTTAWSTLVLAQDEMTGELVVAPIFDGKVLCWLSWNSLEDWCRLRVSFFAD